MLSHQYAQIAQVFRRVQRECVPAWSREEIKQIEQWVQADQVALCAEMDQHTSRVRSAANVWEAQARCRTAKQFAADSYAQRMAMLETILDAVIARLGYLNDSSNDDAGGDYAA